MTTTTTEGALDLSSKPLDIKNERDDIAAFCSDHESDVGPPGDEDSDYSSSSASRRPGDIDRPVSADTSTESTVLDDLTSDGGCSGVPRPFKSYPFDMMSMATAAYPQGVLYQPPSLGPLLDGAVGTGSPLTHFLHKQQCKRAGGADDDDSEYAKRCRMDANEPKDNAYWDRRRKNNEAAKRSRDARRAKEEEIALRAAYLEQENLKLRAQVAILKNETSKLHYMLYSRV